MVWNSGLFVRQTVFVPKELLGDGQVRLEFRLLNSASPAELGLSTDSRKLGICVSGIRFAPVDEASPVERAAIYHWGESLSFVKDAHPVDPSMLTGITSPGEIGSFTDGPEAVVTFNVPPAPADMVLSVEAGAFLVDTRLAEQQADVSVNGHFLGRWEWKVSARSLHELTVPKEYLSGGPTRLEFHVARPTSPAELGLGGDTRKFGIFITKIRLHEAGK